MTRLNVEQIRELLQHMNLSKVAEGADVQYESLFRLARGVSKNPSFELVSKVGKYLEESLAAIKGE